MDSRQSLGGLTCSVGLLMGLLLPAGLAHAQSLELLASRTVLPFARPSGDIRVRRLTAALTPDTSGGDLVVTLSSDAMAGRFQIDPWLESGWVTPLQLTLPAGVAEEVFYFRDADLGASPLMTATAPGYAPVSIPFRVEPQAFSETAETGTLLWTDTPRGTWDRRYSSFAGHIIEISPLAKHRGAWGLSFTDARAVSAAGIEMATAVNLEDVRDSFHLRMWLRVRQNSGVGEASLALLATARVNSVFDLRFDAASQGVHVGGFEETATDRVYRYGTESGALTAGAWHLVEIGLDGLGTLQGRRRLWVDGQLVHDRSGLAWASSVLSAVHVGVPYSDDRQFTGIIDMDDIRGGAFPHAAKLFVALGVGTPAAEGCAALTVGLMDSESGSLRPAPEDTAVSFGPELGGASYFQDATCTLPTSQALIREGTSSTSVFLGATDGTVVPVLVSAEDFLPWEGTVEPNSGVVVETPPAEGDGDAQAQARKLRVVPSCAAEGATPGGAAGTGPWMLAAVVAVAMCRSRKAAARARATVPGRCVPFRRR